MMRQLITLATLLLLFGALGCGGGKGLVSVSGTITLEGTPVHDASVTFVPQDANGTPAYGTTDDAGRFSLSTNGTDSGCKPGKYRVAVVTFENKKTHAVGMAEIMAEKFKDGGNASEAAKTAKGVQKNLAKEGAKKPPLLTPAIYADTQKSPLAAEVPGGNFNFDLKKDAK